MPLQETLYKGISIVTPDPEAEGGQELNSNFIKIADTIDFLDPVSATSQAHVVVERGTTDLESGANLLTAYVQASNLNPGGQPVSATNRVTLIVPPGGYDLGITSLVLDTVGVDLIGSGECRVDLTDAVTLFSWGGVQTVDLIGSGAY